MTSRQYCGALVVLAVSGLVGGVVSEKLLRGGLVAAQGQRTRIVEAGQLRLVDGNGQTRAVLGFREDGGPRVELFDEAGETRALLKVWSVRVYDKADRGLGSLTINPFDGEPALLLTGGAGTPRVGIAVDNGEPGIALFDEADKRRIRLGVSNGELRLTVAGAAGHNRIAVGGVQTENTQTGEVTKHPISTITLFDETGRFRWQAP